MRCRPCEVGTIAGSLVPIASLVIALVVLALGLLTFFRTGRRDYISNLEDALTRCEATKKDLEREQDKLRQENLDLMRRYLLAKNGGTP